MVSDRIGSWAYNTIERRLSLLCRRIISENDFSSEIVNNLLTLADDLPEGKVRVLKRSPHINLPDLDDWDGYVEPYLGQSWLEIPWFFAEAYFYRRVLEAVDYFNLGIDPYALQKRLGVEKSMASIQGLSARVNRVVGQWTIPDFIHLVYCALWGNRVDLSLWPAEEGDRSSIASEKEQSNLLVDRTPTLADYLAESPVQRIDFINDNAGFELFCDLCLADYLLTTKVAKSVRFHLKAYPTFVSDAMIQDVRQTLEMLAANKDTDVQKLAQRLQAHIQAGQLQLVANIFWNSPLVFWEMPENLSQEFAQANLIIVKGDANYRRLLGDCHWDFTTPFSDIVSYFPSPLLALRTMKAELACGLPSGLGEKLIAEDAEWLTNGQRGVIQFMQTGV